MQDVNQALAEILRPRRPGAARWCRASQTRQCRPPPPACEPGDVILKFDGEPIARSSDLPLKVAALKLRQVLVLCPSYQVNLSNT
ncbi:MAG: hypothetical protein MZW92_71690 [Comamonadaceae bacterium]|nr:hypothetical protein [Comamonadaceae bacterium]